MNRRAFMRTLLGVAAATALPSEVWPFRKIFLPSAKYWAGTSILRPSFYDAVGGVYYVFLSRSGVVTGPSPNPRALDYGPRDPPLAVMRMVEVDNKKREIIFAPV